MIDLVKIICKKCGEKKKVVKDTPRHKSCICGECWNWEKKLEEQ